MLNPTAMVHGVGGIGDKGISCELARSDHDLVVSIIIFDRGVRLEGG